MPCEHLKNLYQMCQENGLKISSADVVRITCSECNKVEVCPSMLMDEYDARQEEAEQGHENS